MDIVTAQWKTVNPKSINLLIKRVEAVLRRSTKSISDDLISFEDLKLNLNTYTVEVDNEIIELTLKEFNILKALIEKEDKKSK